MDTDVIAAALLGEPETGTEAARLLAGRWELFAPAHWKAELCNVLWKAARLGRITPESIDGILSLAEALPITSVDVAELWRAAVARALGAGHPAYDVLFVELAVRLGTSVASYDRQLQGRFRSHVKRPEDLLASS
ncbi:MAG TPA: type II toxin-antitoxin system VapC family toxin [Myxococcales bacterium]|nr:type II toxin-antitoxin system VapC family toxin [Myxococcales bacterium]